MNGKIWLYDIALERVRRLGKLSDKHEKERDALSLSLQLVILWDGIAAMQENLEDTIETVSGIPSQGHVLHFKYCLDNKTGDTCICGLHALKSRQVTL